TCPMGRVWLTQRPLILPGDSEYAQTPPARAVQRLFPSVCILPLTTARRRLGIPGWGSRPAGAYPARERGVPQQVAKQVAVAVENALAFDEIAALKEKLEKEKVYLEEEIRTDHNFEEIVGESAALRRVLKEVETVAPTGATVLIRGETGTGK